MQIDLKKLLTQPTSADANERMEGIHNLEEDTSKGESDLTPGVVQELYRIATSDANEFIKKEAHQLLEREEYERFWRCASETYIGYPLYKQRAGERRIPIMILTPE